MTTTANGGRAARLVSFLLVAAVALGPTGCSRQRGAPGGPEGVTPAVSSDAELRSRLEYIANTGVTGSGLGGLPEFFESHPKKADLMADFKKLETAASPEQAKAVAKKMLERL